MAIPMMYFFIGLSIFLIIFLIFNIIMLYKNELTYKNRSKIADAIYFYHLEQINKGLTSEVDYSDMTDYDKCVDDLRNWKYGGILPPEKFEIIKSYIKEEDE